MRVTTFGTSCQGKTTFIEDFIKTFPMYKKADQSYREVAKKNPKVILNENGNAEGQTLILNALCDEAMKYKKDDNIIHDRGVYDNFAYTLWLNYKEKISDVDVEKAIPIVREAGKFYDIIFFFPIEENHKIEVVPDKDGQRSLNMEFRSEVDAIMKSIVKTYNEKRGSFFDFNDSPAIIPIYGTREERIIQAKFYIEPETGKNIEESLLKE